jgi:hypothetical protein
MSYPEVFKDLINRSLFKPQTTTARSPHESQYNETAALSLIAYKNQDPNQRSDLDTAKLNFENKYYLFLMLFGQYSNAPLRHFPLNEPLKYPLTNKTPVFDHYPMKLPYTNNTFK